jgi:hypothetical protein
MKDKIIKFLVWCLWKLGVSILAIPSSAKSLLSDAGIIVKFQDRDHAQESGEWKRHQCYAALIKKFPQSGKRDIALAIELAVRGIQ